MATFGKFNAFVENLAEGVHDLGSDTLKVVLTNTAPTSADDTLSDITQVAGGNGYTTGGTQASTSSSAQSSGTYKLVVGDVLFTAAGGSIGPFRYAVLYNDTPTSPADPVIGYWDYAQSVTIANGESFNVNFSDSNGVLQLA